jgi:peptide deformylase
MAVREILKLGNPELYEKSDPVQPEELDYIAKVVRDLHDTLIDFRDRYGFGLGIAAVQIGIKKQLFYVHVGAPLVCINPKLKDMSEEMVEVWDNCMCFPDLMVKVRRHKTGTIEYRDLQWNQQSLKLGGEMSNLLQHEYDHLEGILAVQRAIEDKAFALKGEETKLG